MRRMISVPLILAAAAALSFLPVQDCLAYGPGDSWYYDHYRRGGPGVEYDYGTAPSGTYDYGLNSSHSWAARVLLWASTRVGRWTASMTLAMV